VVGESGCGGGRAGFWLWRGSARFPPPPPPPAPRPVHDTEGAAAGVGFCDISDGAPPWSWSWPRARAGRSSPHHAATSSLDQEDVPSSLKGENVKGEGGLKGERWKVEGWVGALV
jgi:hypothetical protein